MPDFYFQKYDKLFALAVGGGILAGVVIIANVVAFIILKKFGIKLLRKIEM